MTKTIELTTHPLYLPLVLLKQWHKGRFGAFSLAYPEHIPRALFDPLRIFKDKNKLADRNYEMWTDGTVHEMAPGAPLVTDPELIAF